MRIEILGAALAPAVLILVHAVAAVHPSVKDLQRRCERLSGEPRAECLREAQDLRFRHSGTVKAGAP